MSGNGVVIGMGTTAAIHSLTLQALRPARTVCIEAVAGTLVLCVVVLLIVAAAAPAVAAAQ